MTDMQRPIGQVIDGWVGGVPIVLGSARRELGWHFLDLYACLLARDELERRWPEVVHEGAVAATVSADSLFRSGTIEREAAFFGPFYDVGDGWWWLRVPREGPVADSYIDPRAPRRA